MLPAFLVQALVGRLIRGNPILKKMLIPVARSGHGPRACNFLTCFQCYRAPESTLTTPLSPRIQSRPKASDFAYGINVKIGIGEPANHRRLQCWQGKRMGKKVASSNAQLQRKGDYSIQAARQEKRQPYMNYLSNHFTDWWRFELAGATTVGAGGHERS